MQAEIDRLVEQAHQTPSRQENPLSGLPPEIAQVLLPIFQAASRGQDVGPLLARLRDELLQQAGEAVDATKVDALLDSPRGAIESAKSGGEGTPEDEAEE